MSRNGMEAVPFVLFGLVWLGLVLRAIVTRVPMRPGHRGVHFLLGGLAIYGGIGFFGQAAAATGALSFLPASFEWPVLRPRANVRAANGNTIVGLMASGRVQLYDGQGRFVRGWFVPASGGMFTVRNAPLENIEVVTARSRRRLIYSHDGVLLEHGPSPGDSSVDLASRESPGVNVSSPWPLWPLASPFVALTSAAIGFIGLAVSEQRLKRAKRSTPAAGERRGFTDNLE